MALLPTPQWFEMTYISHLEFDRFGFLTSLILDHSQKREYAAEISLRPLHKEQLALLTNAFFQQPIQYQAYIEDRGFEVPLHHICSGMVTPFYEVNPRCPSCCEPLMVQHGRLRCFNTLCGRPAFERVSWFLECVPVIESLWDRDAVITAYSYDNVLDISSILDPHCSLIRSSLDLSALQQWLNNINRIDLNNPRVVGAIVWGLSISGLSQIDIHNAIQTLIQQRRYNSRTILSDLALLFEGSTSLEISLRDGEIEELNRIQRNLNSR